MCISIMFIKCIDLEYFQGFRLPQYFVALVQHVFKNNYVKLCTQFVIKMDVYFIDIGLRVTFYL